MQIHEFPQLLTNELLAAEPMRQETIRVQKELRRGPSGIIDIDIDGTLITKTDGSITDPEIYDAIEQAQNNGFLVRLNSERPVSSINKYQSRFNTNSVLVGEGGNVMLLSDINLLVINNELGMNYFDRLKTHLLDCLPQSLTDVQGGTPDFRYFPNEDVIEHIGEWDEKKDNISPLSQNLVFMQGSRLMGIGFWVFSTANGVPEPNEAVSARIGGLAQGYMSDSPPEFNVKTNANKSRTFFSINAANVSKSSAWDTTFNLLGSAGITGRRFYHIGNEDADIIGNALVTNLAVANASGGLRQAAQRVSSAPYTGGVVDNLKWIVGK